MNETNHITDHNIDLSGMNLDIQRIHETKTASPSQRSIISYPATHNSILSIKAGPGSGKTYTLSQRIANLIRENGYQPHEILVLSMANRSVNSLLKTLSSTLGDEMASQIDISTFHLFSAKIVDNYSQKYISQSPRKRLVDDITWKYFSSIFLGRYLKLDGKNIAGNLTPKNFEALVSQVRSGKVSSEEASEKFKVNKNYVESLIDYLDTNGVVRYNDLLTNANQIILRSIESDSQLIDKLYNYRVIVVDEFQDMYEDLLDVIKLVMTYPTRNEPIDTCKHLTIAGDPNQSIYDFLGSKPAMMEKLETEFPGAFINHMIIEESFRCTPEILQASIETCLSKDSFTRRLHSVKSPGYLPIIHEFKNQNQEHEFIVHEIIRLTIELGGLLKFSDFAILARSNKEIEEINHLLGNYGISHNKLNSSLLWTKSKVHILLDILNVLETGPGSELALLCILLFIDKEYGGKTRVAKTFSLSRVWASKLGLKYGGLEEFLFENLYDPQEVKKSSLYNIYKKYPHILDEIGNFIRLIRNKREDLVSNIDKQDPTMLLECLSDIVDNLDLKGYLNEPTRTKSYSGTDQELLVMEYKSQLNIELREFHNCLHHCYNKYLKEGALSTLNDSFTSFFLKKYNDEIPVTSDNTVNTSTIHTAKGLEFPVVFICNFSSYGTSPWDHILTESENKSNLPSRLLYVGITRAKDLLYIGTSKSIGEVSDKVIDHYTTILPTMNHQNLSYLSASLKRNYPTEKKLNEGKKLFNNIHQLTQRRSYHNCIFRPKTSQPSRVLLNLSKKACKILVI